MDASLPGRDAVLDQAWRSLSAGASVLVDGPAGIGKTAIWRALVAEAERAGWLVLACAPTEAEAVLPFAALADLLRPLAAGVPALPPPQRAAAEVVLLASHSTEVIDERAVGAAVRSLLEAALTATTGPVLFAVDDAPWLDPPSERAMRFALRRMAVRPATLVTCRHDDAAGTGAPLGLDQGPAGSPVTRIGLTPLGVGALHHVVRARLGRTLSRPLLAQIARDAGGNPLMAIEMARAVLRLPRPPQPGEDLPVASSIQQLLADALRALPAQSRDGVRLAALLTAPTLGDLRAAGVPATALDPAEETGLLVVTPDGIDFAHPAYATAVRAGIPSGIRRRLRRRLADAVADPDERARQLARCTVEPDAAVAGELAGAAERQRARGACEVATELYERAAAITPPEAAGDRGRWRLAAVRCRFDSGDYAAAGAAADAAIDQLSGDQRAEALLLRAMVGWAADDLGVAVSAAERALAAARGGTSLAGRIHAHLALFQDGPEQGRRHAEAAISLLSGTAGDRALLASSLLQLFFHEVRAGGSARTELLDRARKLEDGEPSWLSGTVPAIWWKAIDDHARARTRLCDMLGRAAARGDEPSQHELLTHLGETELLAGRFTAAGEHIAAARELGEQLGTGLVGETWLAGTLDAYQGRLAAAGEIAEAGLRRADAHDDAWCRRIHLQLAGFVALSSGRMAEAASAYGDLAAALGGSGVVEPIALRFEPDWIEACIGAGDLDTAGAVLARLAERHSRLPRPWTTLGLARSRVLLRSAAGADASAELAELAAARASVPVDVLPLDRARCLLVAGLAHRRARRRREARAALDAAVDEFAALGAAAFADRARTELLRIGVRASTPTTLTATERRVARLAAQGRTNRAIADALFISPKTVEANLARVYRKLGISSRAELGAAMAQSPPPD
ncbi:AAA family ATPase [Micromonospora sp. NPDC092111]|uniref:helix-turn-helix transcriptional regulator n=1 Tax=Micromonospora sp. NPDC092111 TaxID=3364289 RepID=UPI00381FCF23